MKGAFLGCIALSVFAGVNAGGIDVGSEDLHLDTNKLLEEAGKIDWEKLSPEILGVDLSYDSKTTEELKEVSLAFHQLGLIGKEEVEDFAASLTDPRMRLMLKNMLRNFPETMRSVLADPRFGPFVEKLSDVAALAKIAGLKPEQLRLEPDGSNKEEEQEDAQRDE